MNDAPDPLEVELAALRPQEVSAEMRQRIGERLAAAGRRLWWLALGAGVAAACLVAAALWWESSRRAEPKVNLVQPRPTPPTPPAAEDSEPTVLAYQRALARSPEDLDALLDRHALAGQHAHGNAARVGAFTRSDAELRALLGEE